MFRRSVGDTSKQPYFHLSACRRSSGAGIQSAIQGEWVFTRRIEDCAKPPAPGVSQAALDGNQLTSLPDGLFSGVTALEVLYLSDNQLTSLPDGLFSGLTALKNIYLSGNPVDPMPLTVTLEKVGTGQVRAKVLAGAPFAVDIPVTPVNGTLAGGATMLRVKTGAVDGAPVKVTRTVGTTAAVTVDVDLSTPPTLPTDHSGYAFARASSGLPATILAEFESEPGVEGQFRLAPETVENYAEPTLVVCPRNDLAVARMWPNGSSNGDSGPNRRNAPDIKRQLVQETHH